jgi:hypothetical protein
MRVGDIARMRKFTSHNGARSSVEYKIPGPSRGKGRQVGVFIYVGNEPLEPEDKAECVDIEATMSALGWQKIPKERA